MTRKSSANAVWGGLFRIAGVIVGRRGNEGIWGEFGEADVNI